MHNKQRGIGAVLLFWLLCLTCLSRADTVYTSDMFTGTAGTNITAHSPDVGGAWTLSPASAAPNVAVISSSGAFRSGSPNYLTILLNSTQPGGTTYTQTFKIKPIGNLDQTNTAAGVTVQGSEKGVVCNYSASARTGYELYYNSVNSARQWVFQKQIAGANTSLQAVTYPVTVGHTYLCVLSTSPSGHTLTVSDNGAVATTVFTDGDTALTGTGGYTGVAAVFGEDDSNGLYLDDYVASAPSAPLAAGTASLSLPLATTSISVSATAPTGGTAPYLYQWYRSEVAASVPGDSNSTVLTGKTALTLSDSTAQAGKVYFYTLVAADSASTPAVVTTAPISGILATSPALVVGIIGDSNSTLLVGNTTSVPVEMGNVLPRLLGVRSVTVIGRAIGGTATSDWLPGSANLNAAEAAFVSAGVTVIEINHGTNDSNLLNSKATYKANLSSIIADLYAHIPTLQKVILSCSIYPNWQGISNIEQRRQLMLGYMAAQTELVNGGTILLGDQYDYVFFGLHPEETPLNSGVHLNDTGVVHAALLRATGIAKALYSAATSLLGRGRRLN